MPNQKPTFADWAFKDEFVHRLIETSPGEAKTWLAQVHGITDISLRTFQLWRRKFLEGKYSLKGVNVETPLAGSEWIRELRKMVRRKKRDIKKMKPGANKLKAEKILFEMLTKLFRLERENASVIQKARTNKDKEELKNEFGINEYDAAELEAAILAAKDDDDDDDDDDEEDVDNPNEKPDDFEGAEHTSSPDLLPPGSPPKGLKPEGGGE